MELNACRGLASLLLICAPLYGYGGDSRPVLDPAPAATTDNLFQDVIQRLLEQARQPIPAYSLSGTIHAAVGNAVDGDSNDIAAPYRANDTPETAQPIPNPVTLGGYANVPGAGPEGRSQLSGDTLDGYQVSLTAGQTISLFIAEDGLANDLDLGLFDANLNLIDASEGTGRFESLTVSQSGDYHIVVAAFQGASNYILAVGQSAPPAAAQEEPWRLSDPFVPGEAVVRFDESAKQPLQLQAQALGMAVKGGDEGRNMLLALEETAMVRGALGLEAPEQNPWLSRQDLDPERRRKWETLQAIKALHRRPEVRYAAPNFLRYPTRVPNDALYSRQWHYPLINLPRAWDVNTGEGAIVAVLDTGVLTRHPDLRERLLEGYDFISDPRNAADGDGIDADATDPGDRALGGRSSFHGTHVTGTVVAAADNRVGVAGVAFSARAMPLRVLGTQGGTDFDIEQALRYAAGLPNDSGETPPRRADVINLSLGGPGFSQASQALYRQVRDRGVVIVAAAGNDANSRPFFPAAYDGVIGVSAVDIVKAPAPYSNFGPAIDVAAPGGNTRRDIDGDGNPDGVLSTGVTESNGNPNADYIFLQGTSMASPHVAGVVALMRSANPSLTPRDIENLLASGALTDDLGARGRDNRFGHGLINAYKAVVAASNTPGGTPVTPVPILSVNPLSLNFGIDQNQLTITVDNGGGGALTVNPPAEDSGGWLTMTPQDTTQGLGTWTATVDRAALEDGIYTATITFTSNANAVSVPVIMQVANNLPPGEIGQHYVVLFDPALQQSVQGVTAVRQPNGDYTFRFDNVPAGVYEIFAGTDLDNDFAICDAGEACGAYLTLDSPVDIVLDRNLENLEFWSSFSASLEDSQAAAGETDEAEQPGIARPGAPRRRLAP